MSKKIAKVQFYFDADVLGLARLLCSERPDFTFPGIQEHSSSKRTGLLAQ